MYLYTDDDVINGRARGYRWQFLSMCVLSHKVASLALSCVFHAFCISRIALPLQDVPRLLRCLEACTGSRSVHT